MSVTNSKNMFFIIVLFMILVATFTYALVFDHNGNVIYTDIREVRAEK